MSDLNSSATLTNIDSFIVKESDSPSFKYLTHAGFCAEVGKALQAQSTIVYATSVPVTIAPFDNLETIVFLDYVSVSTTARFDLPSPRFAGQRVNLSINVLIGTALTSLDIRDDTGVTIFTITSP